MKKFILSLVTSLLLLFSFNSTTYTKIFADSVEYQAELVSENKTIHRGQTFNLDVSLDNNKGLTTLFLVLKFDHNYFTLKDVKQQKEALSNHNMEYTGGGFDVIEETGGFNIFYDGSNKDSTNGKILTLTFETDLETPIGTYPIELEVSPSNTTVSYNVPAVVNSVTSQITIRSGSYIVVWTDENGVPVLNTNISGHPLNDLTGGYEYSSSSSFNKDTDFPDPLVKASDEKYSYTFDGWEGVQWDKEAPDDVDVICYQAKFKLTPMKYDVFYYVDGNGEYEPDGIFNDNDLYLAQSFDYGSRINLELAPLKSKYTFYGWYEDKDFTKKATEALMPSHNVELYGYFKYNIRENNIPTIELVYQETKNELVGGTWQDIAYVDLNIKDNYGLNGLILTIDDYNSEAIKLCGVEWGDAFANSLRSMTNTDNGYPTHNFKLYWETVSDNENNYDTGRLATLKFNVNSSYQDGAYEVALAYDENHDATYFNNIGEIWYSKLMFINTEIPIGSKDSFDDVVDGTNIHVEVKSSEPLPYNTRLVVEDTFNKIGDVVSEETITSTLGNNYGLYEFYDIYYQQNGKKVPDGSSRTVVIELSAKFINSRNVRLYYVDDDGNMILHDSKVIKYDINGDGEDERCVEFTADHFSYWALVGDYFTSDGLLNHNYLMMITFALLFGITACSLLAIVLARVRKGEPVIRYKKGG